MSSIILHRLYAFLKYILILGFVSISHYLLAQKSTLSAGGDIATSAGSGSFSIGQLFYSNIANNDYSILEGVQQPYEISITSVHGYEDRDIKIIVYPNPTQGMLIIRMDYLYTEEWTFRLKNIQGQIIRSGSINQPKHLMRIHDLPESTYLLKLSNENTKRKTFKIIKNNIQ